MKSRTLYDSFANSTEGLAYALHRDWHLPFLLVLGSVFLVAAAVLRLTGTEILLVCVAVSLVVLAELFNSAIEAAVDLVTRDFHPLAKAAKDVASAGVLVAVTLGLIILGGVFINAQTLDTLEGLGGRPAPHYLVVALGGLVTVVVAVILGKLWGGRGTLIRGGLVSAHSALAFFCFVSVCYLTTNAVVWALALVLALLVAQSRVDAGIHTRREVVIGAVVALVVGVALYGTLAMRMGGGG